MYTLDEGSGAETLGVRDTSAWDALSTPPTEVVVDERPWPRWETGSLRLTVSTSDATTVGVAVTVLSLGVGCTARRPSAPWILGSDESLTASPPLLVIERVTGLLIGQRTGSMVERMLSNLHENPTSDTIVRTRPVAELGRTIRVAWAAYALSHSQCSVTRGSEICVMDSKEVWL